MLVVMLLISLHTMAVVVVVELVALGEMQLLVVLALMAVLELLTQLLDQQSDNLLAGLII
jgi:hypothetical protein